ncbi:MAG: MFS transporter [Sulfolobaceae archaeon]
MSRDKELSGGKGYTEEITPTEARKVLAVASIGNLIDYYDFFIAASAASLVWPTIYIQPAVGGNPSLALAISIATYGIAFLARPLGAFIFGHIGDKIGRQSTLVLTLLLAFVGVLGIGLLPPYSSIGIASVILLFVLRFILGLGFGGEWGGGATWFTEFAYRRGELGLYSAIYNILGQLGIAIASIAFTAVGLLLPRPALLDWGWRILFYIGAAALVIGAIIRYLFRESPVFLKIKKSAQIARYPAAEVLRYYAGKILLLAGSWFYITAIMSGLAQTFAFAYISALAKGSPIGGLPPATVGTLGVSIGYIVALFTVVLASGIILDKKRPSPKIFFYISTIASAVITPIFFLLVNSLDLTTIILAYIMLTMVVIIPTSVQAYWYTKEFEAKYRYSGSGLAYQFGGLFGGIFVTFILPSIIALAPSVVQAWPYVTAAYSIASIISLICTILVRETKGSEKELYER